MPVKRILIVVAIVALLVPVAAIAWGYSLAWCPDGWECRFDLSLWPPSVGWGGSVR
jgi:hypothetical protein